MTLFTIARKNNSGAIAWSEEQVRYIIEEYTIKNETLRSLSKQFNVRPETIRNLLRKNKKKIVYKQTKNYPRFSRFFEQINTPEKAYWLGFLYADGCVQERRKSISISSIDLEHVEKFKKGIGAINNKITSFTKMIGTKKYLWFCFTIRDRKMTEDLIKNGCVPRKSWVLEHLPEIEEELMWHFMRGFFDGDGGIYYNKQNSITLHFTGTKPFLQKIQKFLRLERLSLCQNSKSKTTYQLKTNSIKDITRILSCLYNNSNSSIRLDRKYNKARELLSLRCLTLEPVNTGCE